MTPLPKTFDGRKDQKGWTFHLLMRDEKHALLRKEKGRIETWEVVKIRKDKDYTIAGVLIPAHEAMPSPETWGTDGWSMRTLDDAKTKFKSLTGMT